LARMPIPSVARTRPGLQPKVDRSGCLTQLLRVDKRERHGGMVTRNEEIGARK